VVGHVVFNQKELVVILYIKRYHFKRNGFFIMNQKCYHAFSLQEDSVAFKHEAVTFKDIAFVIYSLMQIWLFY